jgi:hypothetical protein
MSSLRRRKLQKQKPYALRGDRKYGRKGTRNQISDSDDAGKSLRSDLPRKDTRIPGQGNRRSTSRFHR